MNNNTNQECLEISKLLTEQKVSIELGLDIDPSGMDYSLDSLSYLDQILKQVHESKVSFDKETLNKVFLRFGCYCGEVIRRESKNYNWLTFEEAFELNPEIKNIGKSIFTYYVLFSEKTNNFIFPISKVSKYIEAGESESLFFYAKTIIGQEDN
jgi:hypothetical protein